MAIDDDRLEFWFQLYGITGLVGLAVNVVSIGKLSHICDKRAKMCSHPFAILPSIIPLTLAALAYVGLMVPATFIHVDEGSPGSDDYYDDVNWIVYVVMLMAFIWPHLYTTDYYSARKWKKYIYSSYRYLAGLANILYWIFLIVMTFLMIAAIVLTGLDHRWTTMGLYTSEEARPSSKSSRSWNVAQNKPSRLAYTCPCPHLR
jgi:ABC-type Fe3+ transport system permease subunit